MWRGRCNKEEHGADGAVRVEVQLGLLDGPKVELWKADVIIQLLPPPP